jgi:hypothetical protein
MALYKQIKVSVEPTLAESFKVTCMNSGVSMAAEISSFMATRANTHVPPTVKADKHVCYDTRPKRRYHIGLIIRQLESIMGFESAYRDHIPENLQAGSAYDDAELTIDILEQVIDLLRDAY